MTLKEAVLAYDAALNACANDPNKMSSFCSAEGQDLDDLYEAMLEAAVQAPQPKGSAPLPLTDEQIMEWADEWCYAREGGKFEFIVKEHLLGFARELLAFSASQLSVQAAGPSVDPTTALRQQPETTVDESEACQGCTGAGTVRSMTSHLGPDDYEFEEDCPACKGTGSADIRDAINALGYWTHRTDISRTVIERAEVLRIVEARAALASRAPAQALGGDLAIDALRGIEPLYLREGESWNECFERVAEIFHSETGYLRPGKDSAAAAHSDEQERTAAWDKWAAERIGRVRAVLAHRATAQAPEQPVHLTERVGSLPDAADGDSGSGSAL